MMRAAVASVLAIAIASAVVMIRRRFALVTVNGSSMVPAISHGERLLVKRVRVDQTARGDVVVVRHSPGTGPGGEPVELLLIKRAVAVAGDPMPAEVATAAGVLPGSPVPAGKLVVLGDNLANSVDSRTWGPFGADSLVGVVLRRR